MPPVGMSHLDFRHNMFKARLEENPFPHTLLYKDNEVPLNMNRLNSIAQNARDLPTEGGHGAYLRKTIGFQAVGVIVVTGPKRRLVEKSSLPIIFGAPFGDNMMTGTIGLLEAVRRRKGLEPIVYL